MTQKESLTPEYRREIAEIIQAPDVWKTREYFGGIPAEQVSFVEVEPEREPAKAREIRVATWRIKLEERMKVLEEAGSGSHEIKHDEETNNLALFRTNDGKRVMWDGQTLTMAHQDISKKDNDIQIPIHPINYTQWIACYNPEYGKAFEKEGMPLPYAGIGVSVLMITSDGFVVLIRRGIETPVYPGRLYSPGGGPELGKTPAESMLKEIKEETGLMPDRDFNPNSLRMLALVEDTHFAGSKHARPELVAFLRLKCLYKEVESTQYRIKGAEQDVWAVEPLSTGPYLTQLINFKGNEMCPPTEAGLVNLLYYLTEKKEGEAKAKEVTNNLILRIKGFKRAVY